MATTYISKDGKTRICVELQDGGSPNPLEDWDEMPHLMFFEPSSERKSTSCVNFDDKNNGDDVRAGKYSLSKVKNWCESFGNPYATGMDMGRYYLAWRDDGDWTETPTAKNIKSDLAPYWAWREGDVYQCVVMKRHEWHDNAGDTMNTWDEIDRLSSVFYGYDSIDLSNACCALGLDESDYMRHAKLA